jgi:hypothetical protein
MSGSKLINRESPEIDPQFKKDKDESIVRIKADEEKVP